MVGGCVPRPRRSPPRVTGSSVVWAGWPARINAVAGGLLGYGILIEICQHTLTTNRFGEPMDVVADVLGIVIARWIIQARTARPA